MSQLPLGQNLMGSSSKWPRLAKLRNTVVFIAVMLMGLGNWADTKALAVEAYEGFVAHFTNQIEDKVVADIDVGNYLPFVEQRLGIPQVVKTSALDNRYEYRYYKQQKYLLALIVDKERVVAVTVHSLPFNNPLLDGFTPAVPFTKQLLHKNSLAQAVSDSNHYWYDSRNLRYFMVEDSLGLQGMNLHLLVGFTEYGNVATDAQKPLEQLEQAEMQGDTAAQKALASKLQQQPMSFYSVSELDSKFIADSLLTKYEFNAYF
ncbi:ETEC_3214 domain-containing protein [Shewanella mangrovi]|nr:ETEC_3214 domain-containing protein [Shewanella mangrovi]